MRDRNDKICGNSLDLGFGVVHELIGVFRLEVLFEVRQGDFVTIFVLSILLASLLNGVVCEVYQTVFQVLQIVLFAGGSQVVIIVPVPLHDAIHTRH